MTISLKQKFADYDNQVPRILHAPKSQLTTGPRVIALAELAGLHLDPWEKLVINESHKIDPDTRLLIAMQVALVVSRQNGKGSCLEALELAWLFITQEELVLHSAHQFKTCADAYKRLKTLIKRVPELDAMVKKFNNSHGHEGIELWDGREMKFIARAGGSGRGFPATKAVLDEAFDLPEDEVSDIMPTMGAAPDGQAWFTSSPVDQEKHRNGTALAKLRWRGVSGKNLDGTSADQLCYMEWSVPEELSKLEFPDPFWWKVANPGYEIKRPGSAKVLREAGLRSELDVMSLDTFGCEHLGRGNWPDPNEENKVLTQAEWNELEDPNSQIVGRRVFALTVSPYGRRAAVSVCGFNREGFYHVEVIKRFAGTSGVVEYLKERSERWRPIAVVLDPRTPAASLINDLIEAKVPVEELKGLQVTQAFSEFYDKCAQQKRVRHPAQQSINEALLGATTRFVGDGLAWELKKSKVDLTGLVAITNALFVFSMKCSGIIDVTESCW